MSLLWRDHVGVALYPDRLMLVRVGRGMRRRIKRKEIIAAAPAGMTSGEDRFASSLGDACLSHPGNQSLPVGFAAEWVIAA